MRILVATLFLPLASFSQTRHEYWMKLNIIHPLKKEWSVAVELHHRRQSNYRSGDKNIFHYPLGNMARVWINYRLSRQWSVVLSPAGYFNNEEIQDETGVYRTSHEFRVSPGITSNFSTGRIKNKIRLLYDARFTGVNTKESYFQSRFRLQNNLTVPVFSFRDQQISYHLSNEILFRKDITGAGFDQDRIYNAIQWEKPRNSIDIGYQWVVQKGRHSVFYRHQLFITLNFSI